MPSQLAHPVKSRRSAANRTKALAVIPARVAAAWMVFHSESVMLTARARARRSGATRNECPPGGPEVAARPEDGEGGSVPRVGDSGRKSVG